MKTKSSNESREGFVLISVMITALILAILAGGVMTRGRLLATHAVRFKVETQREWDAQSGLEKCAGRFMQESYGDFSFTNNGNVILVDTDFYVTTNGTDQYWVESVATGHDSSDAGCRQFFTVNPTIVSAPAPSFVIGSDTNATNVVLTLGNNGELSVMVGDKELYVCGSMDSGSGFTLVDAELYLSGDSTVTDPDIHTYTSNFPPLIMRDLILDKMTNEYDTIISGASGTYPEYDTSTITSFAGQTNVITGDFTVNGDLTIPGSSGMLIITGDLILDKNNKTLTLPAGVEVLVGGSVVANQGMDLAGTPQTLYVAGDMDFENHGNILLTGSLLVGGTLVAKNTPELDGLVFVNGLLDAKNGFDLIDGILLAGELDVFQKGSFTFSSDALPQWLADLLANSMTVVAGVPESVDRTGWTAL